MKTLAFNFLKGKLADASLAALIVDIAFDIPQTTEIFQTSSGAEVSMVGVVSAVGYLWGVVRRFFNQYKYDA